jgi:hypothetical protein
MASSSAGSGPPGMRRSSSQMDSLVGRCDRSTPRSGSCFSGTSISLQQRRRARVPQGKEAVWQIENGRDPVQTSAHWCKNCLGRYKELPLHVILLALNIHALKLEQCCKIHEAPNPPSCSQCKSQQQNTQEPSAAYLATCLAVTAHWFLEQQKTSTELPSSTVSLVSQIVWSGSCCTRQTLLAGIR